MLLDSVGLSFSICEILYACFGQYNIFSHLEKCFNGRLTTKYFFDNLLQTQKFWISNGLDFASFMEVNINHNYKLADFNYFDKVLSSYLEKTSNMNNVMTIILSDHGNKWSDFTKFRSQEGLIDRYHPFLFLILPKNAEKYFSKNELEAMESNQERLLTMHDTHYLLAKFSKQNKG